MPTYQRPTFSYLLLPIVLLAALFMPGCGDKDTIDVMDDYSYTVCEGGLITEFPAIDALSVVGYDDGLRVDVLYAALPGITHELALFTSGGAEAGGGSERHPMPCAEEIGIDTDGGVGDLPALVELLLPFSGDTSRYTPGETTANTADDVANITAVVIATKVGGEVYACEYTGSDLTNAFLSTKTECGPYPPAE